MMGFDEAANLVLQTVRPLPPVVLPLTEAVGRRLAEPVAADRDMPPSDRSAMDGYAVRAGDLGTVPGELRLIGEIPAGSPPHPPVGPGTCVRIMTGAAVPPGADTVVMQETTEDLGEQIRFRVAPEPGKNILRAGEDAPAGAILLAEGRCLRASAVALCAAVGHARVRVYPRPRVAILSTGSELVDPEDTPPPHRIRNSNGPMLAAALRQWDAGTVGSAGRAPDRTEALADAVAQALSGCDVLLLTGGVSVGRYDLVPDTVRAAGGRCVFHGVAVKPGKPVLFAVLPSGKLIFGLPGPPLSSATAFNEFALPAIRRLGGVPPAECRPMFRVPLTEDMTTKGGRVRLVPGKLACGADGFTVTPVGSRSSGDVVCGTLANGAIVVRPEHPSPRCRELVEFHPWEPIPCA